MKKLIIGILATATLACAIAQTLTSYHRLTATSALEWDAVPGAVSYKAVVRVGTNVWQRQTAGTRIELRSFSTNLVSGAYAFEVRAVDALGLESEPGTLAANIAVPLGPPSNARLSGTVIVNINAQ